MGQQAVERHGQVLFNQHPDHPQRMPTQRERVFVAGGQVANAEHANQRFQLVGQGHHHTHIVARQRVPRKTRFVMVFNRVGHFQGQAIIERVIAAHGALQFGKFPHHVGDQVGLGELCGLGGFLRQHIAAQLLANGPSDGAHAFHALALAAQFVVIDHPAQSLDTGSQRFLAVLVEEKFGVRQARAYHALVAANDQAGIVRVDVADNQKLVGQLACRVQQRKVLLVGFHRQDQAFLRHVQKFFFKRADQHLRTLDQRGDFVEQRGVVNDAAPAANLRRCGVQLAHDLGAALGKTGNHRALVAQLLHIAVRVTQYHRVYRGFKPVPVRAVAGLQAQRLHRHHACAMQGHQAVGRAHKTHAGPAGHVAVRLQLVAHHFGNGQFGNGLQQGFLQAFGQRGTGHGTVVKQRFGFAIQHFFQPSHSGYIRAQSRQFFKQRRRGVARSVQTHCHGHQLLRHRLVSGLCGHIRHVRRQTARRGKSGQHRCRRRQPLRLELRQQDAGKRLSELFQRLGRQLFHKQFDQQVFRRHRRIAFFAHIAHAAFLIIGAICSTHSRGAMGKPRRSRDS